VPPQEAAALLDQVMATIKGEQPSYVAEHRVRHRDGHWVWVESRGRVVERNAQGRAVRMIGTNIDITERKRVEQLKTEFVSTVSHELRTPLTSIGGALGLVCGGALGEMPAGAREMLDIAYKNSQRLTHLINDLLDMEKLAAGKMRFDLREQELMPLLEQTLEGTRAYAQQYRVGLELAERADGVRVKVDAGRLQQVLSNYLSNAVKFSPAGEPVRVRAQVGGAVGAGWVRVEVQDRGAGVPQEFRERIFQKFSQADASDTRQKGGTGLGLAISKELMERMHGRVGFESPPGAGACFWFELPVAGGTPPHAGGGA
jgi:signal transduction histidine kinase